VGFFPGKYSPLDHAKQTWGVTPQLSYTFADEFPERRRACFSLPWKRLLNFRHIDALAPFLFLRSSSDNCAVQYFQLDRWIGVFGITSEFSEIADKPSTAQRCRLETETCILKDRFSSVFSQFKEYHLSGNLKFDILGIF